MGALDQVYDTVHSVALRQNGVITHAQLIRLGITAQTIQALLDSDFDFEAEQHSVFYTSDLFAATAWEDTHLAFHKLVPHLFAWEKTSPQHAARYGAVSHFSAAELYGCTVLPIELHLTAPTEHSIPGVHVHVAPLSTQDLTIIEGLPVTTLERTTRDLGALQMDGEHRARWMDFLVDDMGWSVEDVLTCVGPQAAEQSISYFEAAYR